MELISAGAAGEGFIAGNAGFLLIGGVAVAVAASPQVRAAVLEWLAELGEYFGIGSRASATADAKTPEDPAPTTGRASDRDTYEFDLADLATGDEYDVDPSPDSPTGTP